MTPVILSRQQLEMLWEIDRSEIIDTLYKLDNGRLQAYPQYYDVRGWDPHDRQIYTPIHEACYDRGGIFFAFFEQDKIIAAAAIDTLPRGKNGDLRQLLFFYVGAAQRGQGWGDVCLIMRCNSFLPLTRPACIFRPFPIKVPLIFIFPRDVV